MEVIIFGKSHLNIGYKGFISEQNSDFVKLKNTQIELAEIFGATRPSVARAIKQLVDDVKRYSEGRHTADAILKEVIEEDKKTDSN